MAEGQNHRQHLASKRPRHQVEQESQMNGPPLVSSVQLAMRTWALEVFGAGYETDRELLVGGRLQDYSSRAH